MEEWRLVFCTVWARIFQCIDVSQVKGRVARSFGGASKSVEILSGGGEMCGFTSCQGWLVG